MCKRTPILPDKCEFLQISRALACGCMLLSSMQAKHKNSGQTEVCLWKQTRQYFFFDFPTILQLRGVLYLDVLPCTPNAFRYLNRQVDHPTKCFVVQYTAASQSNYILNLQLSFRETTPRNRASCFPPWFKRRDNDLQVPTSHTCRM